MYNLPEDYLDRVVRLKIGNRNTKRIDYYSAPLEDIIVSKLASYRDKDIDDIRTPKILESRLVSKKMETALNKVFPIKGIRLRYRAGRGNRTRKVEMMGKITSKEFFKKYTQYLAYADNTIDLKKLAEAACLKYPRARAPLFWYAYCTGKMERLLKLTLSYKCDCEAPPKGEALGFNRRHERRLLYLLYYI